MSKAKITLGGVRASDESRGMRCVFQKSVCVCVCVCVCVLCFREVCDISQKSNSVIIEFRPVSQC